MLQEQLTADGLEKATLSKQVTAATDAPTNLYLRPVTIKEKPHIAVTFRYRTRDEVKNFSHSELLKRLEQWLQHDFREAVFFFGNEEITLRANRKMEWKLFRKERAAQQTKPEQTKNDRTKKRLLDPKAPWLHALGITSTQGEIRAEAQDKWRQINKYLEVIDALLATTPLGIGARVVDMGAGKGYLTFALAQYLKQKYSHRVSVLGVELRAHLVDSGNTLAEQANLPHLQFVEKDIAEVQKERIDMLIALHACDTATDLALYAGLQSRADIIVVAPCCHKQVRRDMEGSSAVQGLLEFGIMKERQAEMLTDVIRSLLLQTEGYKTKVFEFVGVEHTPKNIMITAERRSAQPQKVAAAQQEINTLKTTFGIKKHFLEELMKSK